MECLQYFLLFAVVFALAPTTLTEEVACMTSLDTCTQAIGYSELLKTGDEVYCCAAGYTMRFDNGSACRCNKTSDVAVCEEGPQACSRNDSIQHFNRARNVTECCQKGFYMQTLHGFINGTRMESCTCSSSPFRGYTIQGSINGSDVQLHFVNYQGQPVLPSNVEKTVSWIKQLVDEAWDRADQLWKSLPSPTGWQWPW